MSDRPVLTAIRVVDLISLGLIGWGIFHAIGAYRHNQNSLRAVVVIVFMLAFVACWRLLLFSRRDREARDNPDSRLSN
jgi:hypothetical protein